jgi:replicative DNA helicase
VPRKQPDGPQVPHSDEAEQIVLDAILSGDKSQRALLDMLRPEEFFSHVHGLVFRAATELRDDGKQVDALSVGQKLESAGQLAAAGGMAALARLLRGSAVGSQVEQAAETIREKAARRQMVYACQAAQDLLLAGAGEAAEIADSTSERLLDIVRRARPEQDFGLTLREAGASLLTSLETKTALRIFSGVATLDATTGGFRAGELIIVAGSTGHGKTILASQIARHACRQEHHTAYFSGEMLAAQLAARRLAASAGVEPWKLRRPETLDAWEWKALVKAAAEECPVCRIVDTHSRDLTLASIRGVSRTLHSRKQIKLIVVDYDELVEVPGEDEWDRQRTLVYGAKRLAMELGVPLILVSQLRKPVDSKDARRPTLEKLYGTGAKSKHASCVLYVDRPYVRELKGDEAAGKIFVLKNRDGRVGVADVMFSVAKLRFEDAPPRGPA